MIFEEKTTSATSMYVSIFPVYTFVVNIKNQKRLKYSINLSETGHKLYLIHQLCHTCLLKGTFTLFEAMTKINITMPKWQVKALSKRNFNPFSTIV